MRRLVVLGRGGSGKSVFGRAISEATGVPYIELDAVFWSADLRPLPPDRWCEVQRELAAGPRWIMDGDLGPYDVAAVRLERADAVVILDLPAWLCGWRALRRSRQGLAFWRWLLGWRRQFRPRLLELISEHAPDAELIVARSRSDVEEAKARVIRALLTS